MNLVYTVYPSFFYLKDFHLFLNQPLNHPQSIFLSSLLTYPEGLLNDYMESKIFPSFTTLFKDTLAFRRLRNGMLRILIARKIFRHLRWSNRSHSRHKDIAKKPKKKIGEAALLAQYA